MPTPATLTRPRQPQHFEPETATQLYARNLRRDPYGRMLALFTKHSGEGLLLSSRSAVNEGCYALETGESAYMARRKLLEGILHRTGPNHPDYHRAAALVRELDAADSASLGMAA